MFGTLRCLTVFNLKVHRRLYDLDFTVYYFTRGNNSLNSLINRIFFKLKTQTFCRINPRYNGISTKIVAQMSTRWKYMVFTFA